MTKTQDNIETEALLDPTSPEMPESLEQLIEEPLWKIRLRLLRKTASENWVIFKKSKIGLVGLVIIGVFALMAVVQPILIATDVWPGSIYDPVVGNEPNPPTSFKTIVPVGEVEDPLTQISQRDALLVAPLANLGDEIQIRLQPAPPGNGHILGTDPLGRDVMSQLMFGARAAFALGIVAAVVTVFLGTTIGSISAYFGGIIDGFFMRLADLLLMLPALALLVALSSVFIDYELWHLAVLIGVLGGFGGTAIVLKSQALTVKVKPFVDAARVAGGSNTRIIFTHIIPNVLPLSFLYMMFTVTAAIALEATLSFLGLSNIDMSWGIMLQLAQNEGYLLSGTRFWWLLFPAGAAVTLMAAAFYLVGRGMDEVVNPRLRRR
ncbi:MAG: ABC transporter permease [Acidimicrobiia bacterium]|nr:ABC transporter permease [Acidimicrobiia bacterium]